VVSSRCPSLMLAARFTGPCSGYCWRAGPHTGPRPRRPSVTSSPQQAARDAQSVRICAARTSSQAENACAPCVLPRRNGTGRHASLATAWTLADSTSSTRRSLRNEKVRGSSPLSSTTTKGRWLGETPSRLSVRRGCRGFVCSGCARCCPSPRTRGICEKVAPARAATI
jgi:hypothetical protein